MPVLPLPAAAGDGDVPGPATEAVELLLERLAGILDRGGVLAVPTESSYGLATDPWSEEGVAAVYRVKVREAGKPLPVVAADRAQIASLGVDPALPQLDLLERIWPAAVTAVLPLPTRPDTGEPLLPAAAGSPTVAVRVPAHDGLRRLLRALGRPLTATSANRSGEPPVLDPAELPALLAGAPEAAVVDGGLLPGGAPSTLVRIRGRRLDVLRQGAVPGSEIARRLAVELGPEV